MASIVVCGGSVIGLASAMLLARDGHEVTVLEADGAPPPAEAADAWESWARRGVAQFHQPHNLFARARQVMDDDLPGLTDALVAAGGLWIDPMATPPPSITDFSREAGDDRFRYVNARRPVIEVVFAHAADGHDGVTVRRGVAVRSLRTADGGGVPRIVGVRLNDGTDLDADLVVDAMGRRTKLPEWLAAIGATPPEIESEDSGFVYNTRYFRGDQPPMFGPALTPMGSMSVLTLRGDNGTWSVTLFAASDDTALRGLRDTERFERVVASCPLHAQWLRGQPVTDVVTMAGILDRHRSYVIDGEPVALGVLAVGDAWSCTNPSAGRGISVGLVHAQVLRDAVRDGVDDPRGLALRFDELTRERATPFYRSQIAADRMRLAEMDAVRRGEQPRRDPAMAALGVALTTEATVFRGMIEMLTCLAFTQDVFARPEFRDAVARYDGQTPTPAPGPDRTQLLDLLR